MIGGWEAVTAIIGVAAVIGSTWASIHRANRGGTREPLEANMEARLVKLEGDLGHAVQGQERLEKEHAEKRRRFEEVVDGIYASINELRKEWRDLLKELRK